MIRFSHAWRCSPHYHCIFLSLMVRIIPAGLNKFKSFFIKCLFEAVLRMCDMIWMRIRILGSVPLTNGSWCGSVMPKNIRIGWGSGSGTLVNYITGRIFTGSVPDTNGSECGSGRPIKTYGSGSATLVWGNICIWNRKLSFHKVSLRCCVGLFEENLHFKQRKPFSRIFFLRLQAWLRKYLHLKTRQLSFAKFFHFFVLQVSSLPEDQQEHPFRKKRGDLQPVCVLWKFVPETHI